MTEVTAAESVLAEQRQQRSRLARERVNGLVASVVHDNLIAPDARGAAVPFQQKTDLVRERIELWQTQLAHTQDPFLEKLAKRLGRCSPYGESQIDGRGRFAPKPVCGSRLCPWCYARSVERGVRLLDMAQPCVLTAAAGFALVTVRDPQATRHELARHQREMKEALSVWGFPSVTRCLVQPHDLANHPHLYDVWLIAALATPTSIRVNIPLTRRGRHIRGFEQGEYAPSDDGIAKMLTLYFSYPEWLMNQAFLPHLPRLVAWTGNLNEFAEVAPAAPMPVGATVPPASSTAP